MHDDCEDGDGADGGSLPPKTPQNDGRGGGYHSRGDDGDHSHDGGMLVHNVSLRHGSAVPLD